jgi:hypothetical protein
MLLELEHFLVKLPAVLLVFFVRAACAMQTLMLANEFRRLLLQRAMLRCKLGIHGRRVIW